MSSFNEVPSEYVQQINLLIEQKLWLQLSHVLKELFLATNLNVSQTVLTQVYQGVVRKYAGKLDGVIYLQLCIRMGSLEVLGEAVEGCKMRGEGALGMWAKAAMVPLLLNAGKVEEAQELIKECQTFFSGPEGVKTPLAGQVMLYQAGMDVAKFNGDFDEYCKQALFFFNTLLEAASQKCAAHGDNAAYYCFSNEETQLMMRLNDYCLASLLSPSIYHFGDLLNVISKFGPADSALGTLVQSFNAGEIKRYTKELQPLIKSNPGLAPHESFLQEKLALMSLAELMFLSCQGTRVLQFSVISEYCAVPLDQVEMLLVKAMAVGLVQGKIDGLEGVYYVERVQPRVLNQAQVIELLQGIQSWRARVKQTLDTVQPFLLQQQHKLD